MERELITQEFDFMDHIVLAVLYEDIWYFSPRHICDNINLSWQPQARKLKNHIEKFNCHHMVTVGQDGKKREMIMIPAHRLDTWILSINAVRIKDKHKRATLELYQNQLSDWLYARNFLTKEEVNEVINVANERGASLPRLSLDEKLTKVLALPNEFSEYKQERGQLIVDVQLGIADPNLVGEAKPLTNNSFYQDYKINGWCDDKLICVYTDFSTPMDIQIYAEQEGIERELLYALPMSFTQMAEIRKAYKWFRKSVIDLVIQYNLSGEQIRYAINWIEHWIIEYFAARHANLPETTRENQKQIYGDYVKNNPLWHQKRDAYFSVNNCCIDCPPELGWEIVSKNARPHHLHYQTKGNEHPDDLVPLCASCHDIREERRGW